MTTARGRSARDDGRAGSPPNHTNEIYVFFTLSSERFLFADFQSAAFMLPLYSYRFCVFVFHRCCFLSFVDKLIRLSNDAWLILWPWIGYDICLYCISVSLWLLFRCFNSIEWSFLISSVLFF
ncbi:hypothetical protein BS78_K337200 [Paspalum vaginatum]|uniref:Transmembrane protein n=1 Tax=Paspalum vaginatum TaxID=158149 RepID=A0A9W7XDJ4_9POAL|nr:hypothetical protein BS78_K337200 [Paspalum vaginatum]